MPYTIQVCTDSPIGQRFAGNGPNGLSYYYNQMKIWMSSFEIWMNMNDCATQFLVVLPPLSSPHLLICKSWGGVVMVVVLIVVPASPPYYPVFPFTTTACPLWFTACLPWFTTLLRPYLLHAACSDSLYVWVKSEDSRWTVERALNIWRLDDIFYPSKCWYCRHNKKSDSLNFC